MPRSPRSTGRPCRREVEIDEDKGTIRIVLPQDRRRRSRRRRREVSLEEARFEDPEFQVGDMMEMPVDFAEFGRLRGAGRQAAHHPARARRRAHAHPRRVRRPVGELLSGEVQQIERGKLVVMLNKFREAEAIIPYREQNHREHFHQGEPIRAVLKRVEETPKGPRLILSRGDPLFVQGALQARGPRDPAGHRRDPRRRARGRQPHQDRRLLARRLDRSGRRVRRASRARACRRS